MSRSGRAACPSSCSGRSRREHLQALRRREFPFSHFGGTCPRWICTRRSRHRARPSAAHRDSRRPALLHRSAEPSSGPSAGLSGGTAGDRAGLRREACAPHRPAPTTTTSPTRRRRSARPARSALGCNAPIARRRPQGGCWRRKTGRRFRLIRSFELGRDGLRSSAGHGPSWRGTRCTGRLQELAEHSLRIGRRANLRVGQHIFAEALVEVAVRDLRGPIPVRLGIDVAVEERLGRGDAPAQKPPLATSWL